MRVFFNENQIQQIKNSTSLLNEGLSQRVWHFTTLESMCIIANGDKFKLTEADSLNQLPDDFKKQSERFGKRGNNIFLGNVKDNDLKLSSLPVDRKNKIYKTFLYFMSLSRTPNCNIGYAATGSIGYTTCCGAEGRKLVRIELDGNKLQTMFKCLPVSFFGHPSMFEYEDRIISNQKYIDNFSKYIIKIDILLTGPEEINKKNYSMIENIKKTYSGKVFVYKNDEKGFNFSHINKNNQPSFSKNIQKEPYRTVSTEKEPYDFFNFNSTYSNNNRLDRYRNIVPIGNKAKMVGESKK